MDYRAKGLDLQRISFLGVTMLCQKCVEIQMLSWIKLLKCLFTCPRPSVFNQTSLKAKRDRKGEAIMIQKVAAGF